MAEPTDHAETRKAQKAINSELPPATQKTAQSGAQATQKRFYMEKVKVYGKEEKGAEGR